MALVLKDRVKETSVSTGTGAITLAGTTGAYQPFSVIGDGNTTYYAIAGQTTSEWEVGIGTYTLSTDSISRDTILSSSNSNTIVTFSAGTKDVFVTYPSEKGLWVDASGTSNYAATIGSTAVNLGATVSTLAGLTSVTVTQDPSVALDLATKQYVDGLVSSGITYHAAVKYEVPDSTGNLTATYNNGTAGVGATLTNAGTQVAFTPDGIVATAGDRVLVYNQTNATQNGVYEVTTVGSGATNWVLTRTTDTDSYGLKDPNALGNGDAFFISSGNTGAGETYVCNTTGVITFGTTAITFQQISASQVYNAGTGLTLSPATTFNIANTAVTPASYGAASKTLTATVNAQGQLTSLADNNIAIAMSQVTSGTLGATQGGTGQSSYSIGDILYADTTTSLARLADVATGNALISGGLNAAPSWGKIALASAVSGTLGVANGGTGSTTAPAAMATLTGFTTTPTTGGTTTLTNTSSYYQQFTGVLTQTIVLPAANTVTQGWSFHLCNNSTGLITVNSSGGNLVVTIPASTTAMVTCILAGGTGANSWESGLTDFSGCTGSGNVVLATSPTLVTPALGTPTSGNFSTGTFTWPTFGVANGGTGATTAQGAINTLAGATTSGQYLRGNGTNVVMSTIQAGDVPTLNQNTTGTASNVTGTVAVLNGGTGSTTAAGARTNLGATTVGGNFFTLTNPTAITFPRMNADNTVSALDAATFRTAIGAGTSSTTGTVTSVAALTLGTTGTDLSSSVATGTTTPVITLNVPTASATNRGALSAADWTTFNGKQAALGFTPYNSTNPSGYIALGSAITGYTVGTNTALAATDTLLAGLGKIQGQINARGTGNGTVTSVSGTAPISVATGTTTPAITIAQANTSTSGYLSSTDWNTFNGKQAAGSYVTVGGALGTPSSGTLTNCTFPTLNQNTTGNAATATFATNSSKLYSTDAAYNYNSANPYYGYLSYNGTRWRFNVSPATPSAVEVAYADASTTSASCTGNAATATLAVTATNFAGIPAGTVMLFIQTSAPTGWTKSTTHDNKALRIVSGTAGSGGSVAFTTAFASQAVSGSVAATAAATATNQATTAGGSIAVTVGAGTLAVGAGTFAVGATTLATTQIPSHTHTYSLFGSGSSQTVASNFNTWGTSSQNTGATGGGTSHTHGLTGAPSISGSPSVTSQTFTGTSHNHTQDAHSHTSGAFTGTAINLAVAYVDAIIATKN
jgi:hypothetical protein